MKTLALALLSTSLVLEGCGLDPWCLADACAGTPACSPGHCALLDGGAGDGGASLGGGGAPDSGPASAPDAGHRDAGPGFDGGAAADGGSPDAGPSVACAGNQCTLQCAAGFAPCRRACQPVGSTCWSATALPGTGAAMTSFLRVGPDGTAHVAFDDWARPDETVRYLSATRSAVSPTEFVSTCDRATLADVQLAGGKLEVACEVQGHLKIFSPAGGAFVETFSHSLLTSTSFEFGFARGLGLLHTTDGEYPDASKSSTLLFPPAGVNATVAFQDNLSSGLPMYYLDSEAIVLSQSPLTLGYLSAGGSVLASEWDPATLAWTERSMMSGGTSFRWLRERAGQVWGCDLPWDAYRATGSATCGHYDSAKTWTWYSMSGLLKNQSFAMGLDSRGQLAIATVRKNATGAWQVVLSYPVGSTVVSEPMFTVPANDWASVEELEFDEHDEPVVLFKQTSGLALLR